MSIRRSFITISLLSVAFVSPAAAADFEWKLFTFFGVNDMPSNLHRTFAEDLTKATNGRLKVTVYAGGELPYKISDVLRVVASNQVQAGDIVPGGHLGEMPGLNVFDVPFVCTSMSGFAKAVEAARPTIDGFLKEKFDIVSLLHWTMPPQQLWLSKNPASIDDVKGGKFRMWSRMHVGMLEKLGAVGVTVSAAEVVAALDRKVIDGAITATIPAVDWRLYDNAKYGYLLSFQMGHQLIGVNGAEFRKLPADLQAIVLAKSREWQGRYIKAIEEADMAARGRFKEKGGVLVEPAAADVARARTLMRPILDQWAKDNGENAQKLMTAVSAACN